MTITLEKVGRRYYATGNTYSIKDRLKSAGFKYDRDRKQWYTGKKELADEFNGADVSSSPSGDSKGTATEVTGRATYKGKSYYVIWSGYTKSGDYAAKLCFRDGSKEFWAKDLDQLQIQKTYKSPRTIADLQEYAQQVKDGDIQTCAECGHVGSGMQDLPDSSGIVAPCCRRCASQTNRYERSYM